MSNIKITPIHKNYNIFSIILQPFKIDFGTVAGA